MPSSLQTFQVRKMSTERQEGKFPGSREGKKVGPGPTGCQDCAFDGTLCKDEGTEGGRGKRRSWRKNDVGGLGTLVEWG